MTTSSADFCICGCRSTGMPRPLSETVTELSAWMVTVDAIVVAGQGFVDGVVDELVDHVVQAVHIGVADVHARSLAEPP